MTEPVYAIGDIHGQREMLDDALERIAADQAREGTSGAEVVFLGDLTDRGPDSAGVLRIVRGGVEGGENWICVKGNHDRMFAGWLRSPDHRDPMLREGLDWLAPGLGGVATLRSYGVERRLMETKSKLHGRAAEAVTEADVAFAEGLPVMHQRGDLLFVHAGIRPGVALDAQVEDDLVWIRSGWLEDTRDHGPLIVHGHTALEWPEHYGNRVNLDGGAGYGRQLTPAVFEGRTCWLLTEEGRVPLTPIGT